VGFCKNWEVSACVDVVLHFMGRIGHHLTRAVYREIFCFKQKIDICRHRIRKTEQKGVGLLWKPDC
jgi:hypothetical protein